MNIKRSIMQAVLLIVISTLLLCCQQSQTSVSIEGDRWFINNKLVLEGTPAEGLLMNVRMVNAVFEDARPDIGTDLPDDFDPEENTQSFIDKIPLYYSQGIRAFTISLQGGMPGYEGAINTGFKSDGTLREKYLNRVERVIRAADKAGAVVILSCFYQRQHTHELALSGKESLINAVRNVATWISEKGFRNVVLEVSNEFAHSGFSKWVDGEWLKSVEGQVELIKEVKATAPGLLVSTSGMGEGQIPSLIAEAADFILLHFNSIPVSLIPERVAEARRYGKPVVCNEDDKIGEIGAEAARLAVEAGSAWGFMEIEKNQSVPFTFEGPADDTIVYKMIKRLTSPRTSPGASSGQLNQYFPPTDSLGGWRTMTDPQRLREELNIDKASLDKAFDFVRTTTSNGGLLVVRNGYLVYERYFGKGQRNATPNLGSCGKSFTSIAVGILMEENPDLFPMGLDQEIFTQDHMPPEAFPLVDDRMKRIKLGQLLSFSAGIRGNNPVYVNGAPSQIDPPGPDGWYAIVDDYALGKKEMKDAFSCRTLWCEPGGGYSYASASIHLASMMLRHVAKMELADFIRLRIAQPLGWGQWGFGYKYASEVSHTPGAGGIAVRSTDMLRFGYLLLRKGRWENKQVVPVEYVRHASMASPYNKHYPYSLQFNVNSNGDVSTLPRDAYWKSGSGGHCLYIVPSLDLVVWKLGGRDGQYRTSDTGLPEVEPLPNALSPLESGSQNKAEDNYVTTLELVIQAINQG